MRTGSPFTRRRWIAASVTMVAVGLLWIAAWTVRQRLGHASFLTGATTWACLVLLLLIGLRRRIPVLPLWTMSTWVQIHLYTGVFATIAYAMHVPSLIASGTFEGGLSLLFLSCSASGVYGWYVSRSAPKRLTAVPGQYRYEQIGWHRSRIAELADGLIDELGATQAGSVLVQFYRDSLQPFFFARPSLAYVAIPSGVRRRRLLAKLTELDRYLEDETRTTAGRFAALVRMRDDLDYHFALLLRLRVWLIVHGVLSLGLVVWASTHALLAIRFAG